MLSTGKIKLWNKLNFSDTAVFSLSTETFSIRLKDVFYYLHDLYMYELSQGFTSSRLFMANT